MAIGIGAMALGAGISATNSLVNSWLSNKMSLKNQKALYDYTLPKDMQANRDMILQSPELQVQGMKRAGLNPSSITGGFQGSASSGDAGASSTPLNMDVLNGAMMFQQMKNDMAMTKANVAKTQAETNYINSQNERYDEIVDSEIALRTAQSTYQHDVNDREKELQTYAVKQAMQNLDLGSADLDYKDMTNKALEQTYEIDGKQVKGYEIPNFKELLTLKLAEESMRYNWSALQLENRKFEADPQKLFMDRFGVPLMDYMKEHMPEIWEQVKDKVSSAYDKINNMIPSKDDVMNYFMSQGVGLWKGIINKSLPPGFKLK